MTTLHEEHLIMRKLIFLGLLYKGVQITYNINKEAKPMMVFETKIWESRIEYQLKKTNYE